MNRTSADHHLAEADRALRYGRSADARHHLEAALKCDPTHPVVRNRLGIEALATEDYRAAAEHFGVATDSDPAAIPLWINLAKARRLLGDIEGERLALESALAQDQRDLTAIVRLAELHERLGEAALATDRWTAVIALSSEFTDAPADLRRIIEHARHYVGEKRESLGKALSDALESDVSNASARDRRRVSAAVDYMLGRRSIYANHCDGLHYPFLPADEYFDRDHFPWLQTLEASTDDIRRELEAILANPNSGFAPYVEQLPGVPENKWSPLDRSLDWGALHLWRDGERIDEACARAPKTAALVETLPLCRIPGRAPAVFFSILKAGRHIPPHTGVTNVRAIVHLPLIVPEGCTFRVGGETRAWVEGQAFVFDDTIEHEAHNPTDRDRAVLIVDCWNPYLSEAEQAMIRRIYEVRDAQRAAGANTSVPMQTD